MDYNAQDIERKYYEIWEKRGYFEVDSNKHIANGRNFCIMMPPPNITGSLHIGHALTYTLQDIITRFKRMEGFRTLWQPGIDHAGIATQNVVEKQLLARGIKKEQIGREAFLSEVWAWKEKSGGEIVSQLKRLGASAAWNRMRFTMDKGLQNAVKKAFVAWYEKGLIFQGDYMVNWCTHDGALSDIEVEFEENKGKLYYLRYFLKDSKDFIIVATTRPETYFGDTAVMVNPQDERYRHLLGRKVVLPLIEREVEIIGDESVDIGFGTGAVKVTPAHDNNDYEVGLRHKLDFITIFDKSGILNEHCGEFRGLERLEARNKIISKLESCGFVEKIDDYTNQVGKCYRCGNIVEPYISKQWFVKKSIAKETIKRVNDGECRFYPNQWINNFNAWMGDLRDWCISRQLWWGHRIPVFYCDECGIQIASPNDSETCKTCGKAMRQDEDVLDTWFSSGLWAFSTLGWGNLSFDANNSVLGVQFRTCENFEHSQTHSLASRPKFSKEAKAFTASRRLDKRSEVPNTRILRETQESQGDSITSSLRGEAEAIHLNIFCNSDSKNFIDSHSHNGLCDNDSTIDCHDSATQNLAMTEKGDSAKSSRLCEGAKQTAPLSSLRGSPQGLTKQSIKDSINSSDFVDSSDSKNAMDCHEFNKLNSRNDDSLSSLRGQRPKQSIKSCEAQPTLAPLRGSKIERKGGSSASALLELEADKARLSPKSETAAAVWRVGERGGGAALFAKKSDYINENISAESRRSERAESHTESLKDSSDSKNAMDCHANPCGLSRNDGDFLDCNDSAIAESHNDANITDFTAKNLPFNANDLSDFYPNSLLITSFDILFFWVARMLFSGESLLNKLPFKDIYLHALVCDEFGKKMSKSKGNVINPLELIESHSSDILRFCLAYNCIQGRDIRISQKSLTIGNALAVKLINALNFLLLYKNQQNASLNPHDSTAQTHDFSHDSTKDSAMQNTREFYSLDAIQSPLGLYMYAKFNLCVKEVKTALDAYRFNDATNALYRFLFNDFCDFGIEAVKAQKEAVFELGGILRETMKLLHPFMPFISEFIWQNLNGTTLEDSSSIMIERFPIFDENLSLNADFETIRDIITSIRRAKTNIDLANKSIAVSFIKANLSDENLALTFVPKLAKCEKIEFIKAKMEHCIFEMGERCEVYIPANELDLETLIKKIEAKIAKTSKEKEKLESMLKNPNFIKNAPKNLIDSNQEALSEAQSRLDKLESELKSIKEI